MTHPWLEKYREDFVAYWSRDPGPNPAWRTVWAPNEEIQGLPWHGRWLLLGQPPTRFDYQVWNRAVHQASKTPYAIRVLDSHLCLPCDLPCFRICDGENSMIPEWVYLAANAAGCSGGTMQAGLQYAVDNPEEVFTLWRLGGPGAIARLMAGIFDPA